MRSVETWESGSCVDSEHELFCDSRLLCLGPQRLAGKKELYLGPKRLMGRFFLFPPRLMMV